MANSVLQSLSEIFNNRFFRIPDYQRGYAWEDKQLKEFWRDIENLDKGRFHYTGVLTVKKVGREEAIKENLWKDDIWLYEKGFKSFYIIDGQQRLLTFMILIKVILDRFEENEEINYSTKSSWTERYFYQKSERYESFIFGYINDDPSDIFFKTKVLCKDLIHTPIEETLYTANLKYAKEFFIEKTKSKSKEELEDIISKAANYFRFNLYEIDDELDVFVTFETMNNRGRLLSKLELLKDRMIYLSTLLKDIDVDDKNRLRKEINTVWKNVYTFLGKNTDNLLDDDKFLEKHWLLYYETSKNTARLASLLDEYFTTENVVNGSSKIHIGFEDVRNYINSLSECVERWFYIHNPMFSPYCDEIKVWLEKISRLDNIVFYPLIMAVLTKEMDEIKIVELLKAVERFIFLVFKITKRKASTGDTYFGRMAHSYYFDKTEGVSTLINEIHNFTDSLNNKRGFDITYFYKEIEDNFDKMQDGFYGWDGIRYFLYEYELYLETISRSQRKLNWEEIKQNSIEHIFPQTPKEGSEWGRILGRYKLNKKEKYRVLHSLGNLLLLSIPKNSELQGYSFEHKKKHEDKNGKFAGYGYGSYSEKEVADFDKWSPDEVVERGMKLIGFMETRWRVEIDDQIKLLGLEFLS
ncbi:MAG: hypothetical protein US15_C0036G0008 [Candidatus Moranbacteria bacterium GW2011_GWF1_36_4]|nr:MAG: hypothetical protein US15_C0036G0008 [Candidatus Moranbacteria bacterium GW2011_GWF1_36_4]